MSSDRSKSSVRTKSYWNFAGLLAAALFLNWAFNAFPDLQGEISVGFVILFILTLGSLRGDAILELLWSILQAGIAYLVAVGLIYWIARDYDIDAASQYAVTIILAVVIAGTALLARYAHIIREAEEEFGTAREAFEAKTIDVTKAASKIEDGVRVVESASAQTHENSEKLAELIAKAESVMERAQTARIAADVLKLEREALEDRTIAKSIHAALGSIRTWVQAGQRRRVPSNRSRAPSVRSPSEASVRNMSPGERAWWRSLEIYHCEERYDLARSEIVTNARNYTYILTGLIDEFCEVVDSSCPKGPTKKLVVLQCTTFPPKDFYNFPDGPKGNRTYRDFEFYGTYRRLLSLLNCHPKVKPHRIIFVADSDRSAETTKVEGWRLDTRDDIKWGSARLMCAPYALPLDEAPVPTDGIQRFCSVGWSEKDTQLPLTETPNVCPVFPYYAHSEGRLDFVELEDRRSKAEKYSSDFDGADKNLVSRLVRQRLPSLAVDNPAAIVRAREALAWKTFVQQAAADVRETCSELEALCDEMESALQMIDRSRRDVLAIVAEGELSITPGLAEEAREVVPACQQFDATVVELKSQAHRSPRSDWGSWADHTSSRHTHMGPAESWLYHFMNYIDLIRFARRAADFKALPVWDLFVTDVLGDEEGRTGNSPISVEDQIRFVPVRYELGERKAELWTGEGVLSGSAFDRSGYSREFTLCGVVETEQENINLEDVDWEALLCCEIAPPYSTCRLNLFMVDDTSDKKQKCFDAHKEWVLEAWKRTQEFSSELIGETEQELEDVRKQMEQGAAGQSSGYAPEAAL